MPLFLFISGYLSAYIYRYTDLKKRARQLLLPFTAYAIISPRIYRLFNGERIESINDYITNHLIQSFIYPEKGLWFLWALFFICSIYVFIRRITIRYSLNLLTTLTLSIILCSCVSIMADLDRFAMHQITRFFVIFSLGAIYKIYEYIAVR